MPSTQWLLPITASDDHPSSGRCRAAACGSGRRYGTILLGYSNGCSNGVRHYNHDFASADSSSWAGDSWCRLPADTGCRRGQLVSAAAYFQVREFLGAGLVQRPLKLNELLLLIIKMMLLNFFLSQLQQMMSARIFAGSQCILAHKVIFILHEQQGLQEDDVLLPGAWYRYFLSQKSDIPTKHSLSQMQKPCTKHSLTQCRVQFLPVTKGFYWKGSWKHLAFYYSWLQSSYIIITYYSINNYYSLLHFLLLHCYDIIVTY